MSPNSAEHTIASGRDLHLYNEIGEETSHTNIDQREDNIGGVPIQELNTLEVELQDLSNR